MWYTCSGLGKETARAIIAYSKPKCVILLCRSLKKAEATRAELIAMLGKSTLPISETVRGIEVALACDLASLDSVTQTVQLIPQSVDINLHL
jgi:NAD(P)-dependent dehydrogenase (short-subunit alcohol dehydrogenase family)